MDKESVSNQTGIMDKEICEQNSVEQDNSNKEEQNGSTAVSNHRPFTSLTQVEQDFAVARALQEQERAFRMLRGGARALQGAHNLDSDGSDGDYSDRDDSDGDYSEEDSWHYADPDNMSYEELVALTEAVGVQSKGLSSDMIASLPSSSYVADHSASSSSDEQCVICCHKYKAEDNIVSLPCKHQFHTNCIHPWLQINRVCPLCSVEVTGCPESEKPPAPST